MVSAMVVKSSGVARIIIVFVTSSANILVASDTIAPPPSPDTEEGWTGVGVGDGVLAGVVVFAGVGAEGF
jgi:hypothetical protein